MGWLTMIKLIGRIRYARFFIAFVLINAFSNSLIAFGSADLTISMIDVSNFSSDCQSLVATGTISITVDNNGTSGTGSGFTVLAFEDADGNGLFDRDLDLVLGSKDLEMLAAGESVTATVDTSGMVSFSGNIVYGYADSSGSIPESDEDNNYYNSGLNCEFEPVPGTFDPEIEWSWSTSGVLSAYLNVMMTPGVADLNDDGVPDVVFGATNSTGGGLVEVGVLRALNGKDGSEIFTVSDATLRINTAASVAVGDIDLDGKNEIVACDSSGAKLIAFENDGAFKWRSLPLETINWGAPALADLDGNGTPEIVVGRQVLNNDGSIRWTGSGGRGSQSNVGPLALVADVNMDGNPEVVAGNTVYTASGAIFWQAALPDGYNAIANFDDDTFPEIVLVSGGTVRLLEHDGSVKWGPVSIPGGGAGGPPTVADFDNDGQVEIGVAGAARYAVFETDGTLKWAAVTQDISSNRTGSSVFDFEGDGSAEVVYSDEKTLRIYRGTDGFVLYQLPLSSCTWHEYPLVADVDADGNAEIVAVANNNCGYGPQRGVFVIGDASDNWVATRKIWNQHTYHITNVSEDGTIPASEENNWERYNNFRQNLQTEGSPLAAPDLTASFLQVDKTVCPESVGIIVRVGNGGSNLAAAPVNVSFYDGDPSTGGTLLGVTETTRDLSPGQFEDVTLALSPAPVNSGTICAVADENGTRDGSVNECDEMNNQCCAELSIVCNRPPDCSQAIPSLSLLWPPNHKLVPVKILGVTDPDEDPITIILNSIFQDEPVDTIGDGSFVPDGLGIGTETARLRAERVGSPGVPGNGRVYHIGFTANDGMGGTCSGEVLVGVPHDQGAGTSPIDDGALYDSTMPP